jgi:DNA-directed RNA polymerase subunit RPC12/RpoP
MFEIIVYTCIGITCFILGMITLAIVEKDAILQHSKRLFYKCIICGRKTKNPVWDPVENVMLCPLCGCYTEEVISI